MLVIGTGQDGSFAVYHRCSWLHLARRYKHSRRTGSQHTPCYCLFSLIVPGRAIYTVFCVVSHQLQKQTRNTPACGPRDHTDGNHRMSPHWRYRICSQDAHQPCPPFEIDATNVRVYTRSAVRAHRMLIIFAQTSAHLVKCFVFNVKCIKCIRTNSFNRSTQPRCSCCHGLSLRLPARTGPTHARMLPHER